MTGSLRGMGTLYKRGRIWWVKYYVHGCPMWESTRTTRDREAKDLLKERLGRVATGQTIPVRMDQRRYEEARP